MIPAERDVALFALKGIDVAEIAQLRCAAQGTLRVQLPCLCQGGRHQPRPVCRVVSQGFSGLTFAQILPNLGFRQGCNPK